MEEKVTITKEEYDRLQEDSRLLECLRDGGVDNWVGWDDACERLNEGDE